MASGLPPGRSVATHYEQTARRVVQLLRYALKCTEAEARRAVQAVGPDFNEAAQYIKNRRNNPS